MRTYAITYINSAGNTATTQLSAPNKFLLTMKILEDITDMKNNNADNIIAVEEV